MKSVAVFLLLAFLTGFQAAVLSEEPPPSISEPNQTILEQVQGQISKISSQVTEGVNNAVQTVKGQISEKLADIVKAPTLQKFMNRKLYNVAKDVQQLSQSAYNQGREAMNDQINKVVGVIEDVKAHPVIVAMSEEVIEPAFKKTIKLANWVGEHSLSSIFNPSPKVQKKTSS